MIVRTMVYFCRPTIPVTLVSPVEPSLWVDTDDITDMGDIAVVEDPLPNPRCGIKLQVTAAPVDDLRDEEGVDPWELWKTNMDERVVLKDRAPWLTTKAEVALHDVQERTLI